MPAQPRTLTDPAAPASVQSADRGQLHRPGARRPAELSASCTPPAGSTGFAADDWTTVVNDLLARDRRAQQVLELLRRAESISSMRTSLSSIAEGAELPAIGGGPAAPPAAGEPESADFNTQSLFAGLTRHRRLDRGGGARGGTPEASAALWVRLGSSSPCGRRRRRRPSSIRVPDGRRGPAVEASQPTVTHANKAGGRPEPGHPPGRRAARPSRPCCAVSRDVGHGTRPASPAPPTRRSRAGCIRDSCPRRARPVRHHQLRPGLQSGGEPNLCVAPTGPGVSPAAVESFIMAGPKFWSSTTRRSASRRTAS